GEIIEYGVDQGIIEKAGSWYSYGSDRIGQGKENVRAYLKENLEVAATIEAQIRATLMPEQAQAPAKEDAPDTDEAVAS
ncbi:MAG: DNA recombination/repair protein RecA, partial [Pseudomonadota bacterium]|nr:DNA recombination/repair protein RecA [Pseudomonadota bacterium]